MSDKEWWETLEHVMVFSNSTRMTKFCDFVPRNRHVLTVTNDILSAHDIRNARVATPAHDAARSLNVDWVYASR